jgi:large subunit ribosomal protein L3
MSNGFRARKLGMTQIYNTDGTVTPVSVLEVLNHKILNRKTMNDGTVQVLFAAEGIKKRKNKSDQGVKSQYDLPWNKFILGTYRLEEHNLNTFKDYENLDDSVFDAGILDVSGITKGKGTAGVMKKWGFKGQRASHGSSKAHRLPGGMGGCQDPGRVTIGKKQAGRMGAQQRTIKNVKIVSADKERRLLFVEGSVMGNKNSIVSVRKAFGHSSIHSNYKYPRVEKTTFEKRV